MGSIITEV